MTAIFVTRELRKAITEHYHLRDLVTAREVNDEYKMLVRKGAHGIVGDHRLEALRAVFVRHGLDPVHGPARCKTCGGFLGDAGGCVTIGCEEFK